MAEGICDICGFRPGVARVSLIHNGRKQILEVCKADLARLQQRGPYISSLDALFAGEGFFGNFSPDIDQPEPSQRRYRETVDISQFLSQHAKSLIQKAAAIAAGYGRIEIDTEHLLSALMESDVVLEILKQFKIKPEDIKGYIEANTLKEDHQEKSLGISPRLKRVLEQAFAISQELGHGYIGPEHLVIALAEEDEGLAGDLLRKYGVTPQALRQKAVRVVGEGAQEGTIESQSVTPELDKYSRDLSKLARAGKLDPVIGRSDEIETTIEILSRRTKNNPVLIGEPGVGKTAIVEGLAQRITNDDVPETLRGKRVVEVNLNSMVAGSKFRGEFEERIRVVLDEIIAHKDELVIFVDELHTIIGAGGSGGEGGLDVSNVIKPSLARGELHLIGATTLNEYQKHIEKDSALERRFQPVLVDEPTVEQTIEILRGLRDKYEAFHRVKISDDALVAAAQLSDRYISHRFLPDKAIDLIDQASSRLRIALGSQSDEMRELDEQIAGLRREQEYARSHKQFDKAKELETQISEAEKERDTVRDEWRRKKELLHPKLPPKLLLKFSPKLRGFR